MAESAAPHCVDLAVLSHPLSAPARLLRVDGATGFDIHMPFYCCTFQIDDACNGSLSGTVGTCLLPDELTGLLLAMPP